MNTCSCCCLFYFVHIVSLGIAATSMKGTLKRNTKSVLGNKSILSELYIHRFRSNSMIIRRENDGQCFIFVSRQNSRAGTWVMPQIAKHYFEFHLSWFNISSWNFPSIVLGTFRKQYSQFFTDRNLTGPEQTASNSMMSRWAGAWILKWHCHSPFVFVPSQAYKAFPHGKSGFFGIVERSFF